MSSHQKIYRFRTKPHFNVRIWQQNSNVWGPYRLNRFHLDFIEELQDELHAKKKSNSSVKDPSVQDL